MTVNVTCPMTVNVTCPNCDGAGGFKIAVAVCCGNGTTTGECCNNPIAGEDVQQCELCDGSGEVDQERLK